MAYIGAGITRFNTADELTVTGTSEFGGNVSFGDNNITNVGSLQIDSIAGDADTNTNITFAGNDVITMTTAGSERLRITSAGSVGIGTSSPATTLEVNTTLPVIRSTHSTSGDYLQLFHNGSGAYIDFSADPLIIRGASNAERMRIDTSGNVAIGGADTAYGKFSVRGGFVYINEDNANTNQIYIRSDLGGDPAIQVATSHALKLFTSNQERLRIDSSGNLLVGRTDTSSTTAGTVIYGGSTKGAITQTFAGRPLYINRLTTDGDIIEFAKDGTTVGNIGVNTDRLFIGDSSFGGIAFPSGGSGVLPAGGSGALNDNTHDLGNSSTRFKDLYLSSSAKITNSSGNASVELTSSTSGTSFINMGDTGDADIGQISYVNNGNSMRFTTNASERMRIDSGGNVGIGNSSPSSFSGNGSQRLVVGSGSGTQGLTVYAGNASYSAISFADGTSGTAQYVGFLNYNHNGDHLQIGVNASERVRIDSSGRVGIGTSSPQSNLNSSTKVLHLKQDSANGSGVVMESDSCITEIISGSNASYFYNYTSDPMLFGTNNTERMRIDSSGRTLINATTANTGSKFIVAGGAARTSSGSCTDEGIVLMPSAALTTGQYTPWLAFTPQTAAANRARAAIGAVSTNNAGALDLVFATRNAADGSEMVGTDEKMRLDSSGNLFIGKTSRDFNTAGIDLNIISDPHFVRDGNTVCSFNRLTNDGTLINFGQAGSIEGSISVSGSTVSYNGGHLSRWSQATDGNRINGLVKGTVMTNLDQMAEWTKDGVTEENEQLNCMAVSSVEGDANVAGVFVNWDEDDTDFTTDMNIAMTGDMVIRIASGTTVARGDLLMSAGDGTAKPQGDDIVRSKTIAKVTSTTVSHTYDDGTYLVPCVLMAC